MKNDPSYDHDRGAAFAQPEAPGEAARTILAPRLPPLTDRSDDALFDELRRVAALVGAPRLTRDTFRRVSGRVHPETYARRFGGWREALERAGLGHLYGGRTVTEKMRRRSGRTISCADLIADLRRVRALVAGPILTECDYDRLGRACAATIRLKFGSWAQGLEAAGIRQTRREALAMTDDELFDNLEGVIVALGRWPLRREMASPLSRATGPRYVRRWGSWPLALATYAIRAAAENRALPPAAAVDRQERKPAGRDDASRGAAARGPIKPPRPLRQIRPALRYAVFHRDRLRCQICGVQPGPDNDVAFEIDHIVPVSKGGGNEMENLQTVCVRCNRGKSDHT